MPGINNDIIMQACQDAVVLGTIGKLLMTHLVDVGSSLFTQLEDASQAAHMLFVLYREHGTKFIPSQLYDDLQVNFHNSISNMS